MALVIKLTIPLAPVSKKNSQRILKNRSTGAMFVAPSETFKVYEYTAGFYIHDRLMIDYPVNVRALFYMPTRRVVDLVNLEEALLDVLVTYGILKDDNFKIVASMDGSRVLYDKEKPRTEIWIEEVDEV